MCFFEATRWGLVARTTVLALSLFVTACADDLTEVIVVVETDMPTSIDEVVITASDASGVLRTATTTIGGVDDARFPLTLGLVAGDDKNAEFTVEVQSSFGGSDVLRAEAQTHFIEGKRLVLRILLASGCVSTTTRNCASGTTCSFAGSYMCVSATVDASTLPEWTGSLIFSDAGTPNTDAGGNLDARVLPDATAETEFAGDGSRSGDGALMPISCNTTADCTVDESQPGCTVSMCNTSTNMCVYQSLLCDDEDPCTNDVCTEGPSGRCDHLAIEGCLPS